jgi:hypothetical protein
MLMTENYNNYDMYQKTTIFLSGPTSQGDSLRLINGAYTSVYKGWGRRGR